MLIAARKTWRALAAPAGAKAAALFAVAVVLGAGSAPPPRSDAIVTTRLGKTFEVGPVHVTPLQVVEDKRCPKDTRCDSGDASSPLRLRALIETARGSHERVLVEGTAQAVDGGKLLLADIRPLPDPIDGVVAERYRFVMRYSPN